MNTAVIGIVIVCVRKAIAELTSVLWVGTIRRLGERKNLLNEKHTWKRLICVIGLL